MPRESSEPEEELKPIRRPKRKDDQRESAGASPRPQRPDYSDMTARAEKRLQRSLRTIVQSQADLDELEDDDYSELERLSRREMGNARASRKKARSVRRPQPED